MLQICTLAMRNLSCVFMNHSVLDQVYHPEIFKEKGMALISMLSNHLNEVLTESKTNANVWESPEQERVFWKDFLKNGDETTLFKTILDRSIHVHHPKYIGHQVTPTAPITALSSALSAFLNNGMAVYEMGKASSAIERIITDSICEKIGFDNKSRGILTSGGTLANLTALLSARKAKVASNVWSNGHGASLGILVSEEAHYCVDRAARIMGLGDEGIIKIKATSGYGMDVSCLGQALANAKKQGIQVFAIVGSAPSTSTGIYDDLEAIAAFSKANDLWFHVDGAHGGAAIYSNIYRHTVKGIEQADSVVIDGHKMMMMPALTTALLYKNGEHSQATFQQKADYLLQQSDDEDWYNIAKRSFECTKTMMSIHWFTLLKLYGESVFDAYVTTLYDKGIGFAKQLKQREYYDIAVAPMSNIVCFRYTPNSVAKTQWNELNIKIRQALLEDGEFYIVQTKLRGINYLRVTIMNPYTTETHFANLLKKIETIAESLITGNKLGTS